MYIYGLFDPIRYLTITLQLDTTIYIGIREFWYVDEDGFLVYSEDTGRFLINL